MMFCRRKKKRLEDKNLIFIKDLIVEMEIGAYESEKGRTQPVCINVIVEPSTWSDPSHDNLEETISYDLILSHILSVTQSGHIHLAETVGEKIAEKCLNEKNIRKVTVRVEKVGIYKSGIPGIEISRSKPVS